MPVLPPLMLSWQTIKGIRKWSTKAGLETSREQRRAIRKDCRLPVEVESAINPQPPPEPEPTVVYVEATEGSDQLGTTDFNPKLWMQKPRPWW
jgi:hypothetical protein